MTSARLVGANTVDGAPDGCAALGDALLDHPNRAKLHAIILRDPGINFRQLSRVSGLACGTARHHLTALGRAGLVVEQGFGSTRRFFGPQAPADAQVVVLLREPALKHLHDWVQANPGASQGHVLDAMTAQGWSRSTTQHRLHRLVEGGAIDLRCQGRFKRYWAGTAPTLLGPLHRAPAATPRGVVQSLASVVGLPRGGRLGRAHG